MKKKEKKMTWQLKLTQLVFYFLKPYQDASTSSPSFSIEILTPFSNYGRDFFWDFL